MIYHVGAIFLEVSPRDMTVWTDLCAHNVINTHIHTHRVSLALQLARLLAHSLSLILALLPRLPYSLLLHIPRRSCRLWISLSSRIQTKENPSDFLYLYFSFSHTHTHTNTSVDPSSPTLTHVLCLSLSVCLLLTCKPSSPRQRSSKGIAVVLGVWLLVFGSEGAERQMAMWRRAQPGKRTYPNQT